MLAVGRKHERVIAYLQKELKQRNSLMPRIDAWWDLDHGLIWDLQTCLVKWYWSSANSQPSAKAARPWTWDHCVRGFARDSSFMHNVIDIRRYYCLISAVQVRKTCFIVHQFVIWQNRCRWLSSTILRFIVCLTWNVEAWLSPHFRHFNLEKWLQWCINIQSESV